MTEITISTLNTDSEIRDNLFQEINFLNREGLQVELTETLAGRFLFLNCVLVDKDDAHHLAQEKIMRSYLATIITDMLMNGISKGMMSGILKKRYHYLAKGQLKNIVQKAHSYLNNLYEGDEFEQILVRHNFILKEVNDYLKCSSNLFLEGFIRFRLKNYFREIEESVEKAVDNFLVEQEYYEFIKLLRYFVDIQEPRIDEVHVFFKNQQNFYLLDEEKKPINQQQLQQVLSEFSEDIEYDDLLLSALITISPRRIVMHVMTEVEIIETIVNVFQERVTICKGCSFCNDLRKTSPIMLCPPLLEQ